MGRSNPVRQARNFPSSGKNRIGLRQGRGVSCELPPKPGSYTAHQKVVSSLTRLFRGFPEMTDGSTPEPFFTEATLARKLAVSKPLLRKWRRLGTGPQFFKMGRCVRYAPEAVQDWLSAKCGYEK